MISRRRNLQDSSDVRNSLALAQELTSGPQLADDLLGVMAFEFHEAFIGQVWPTGELSFTIEKYPEATSAKQG